MLPCRSAENALNIFKDQDRAQPAGVPDPYCEYSHGARQPIGGGIVGRDDLYDLYHADSLFDALVVGIDDWNIPVL